MKMLFILDRRSNLKGFKGIEIPAHTSRFLMRKTKQVLIIMITRHVLILETIHLTKAIQVNIPGPQSNNSFSNFFDIFDELLHFNQLRKVAKIKINTKKY